MTKLDNLVKSKVKNSAEKYNENNEKSLHNDSDYFLLDYYKKQVMSNSPSLLTKKEEEETIRKIRAGDREAYLHFFKVNLRLVMSIARRYSYFGVPYIDLISEGNIELMKLIHKFDTKQGFCFSTYATTLIKKKLWRSVCKHSRTVRVPEAYFSDKMKYLEAEKTLLCKNATLPTNQEIEDFVKKNKGWADETRRLFSTIESVNTPVSDDSQDTHLDILSASNFDFQDPEEIVEQMRYSEIILKLLEVLDNKSASIIKMYFGLDGCRIYTHAEIGKVFNLTDERIRQIRDDAQYKMYKQAQKLGITLVF